MGGPRVTLYVDIVSPFAYLAYYLLRHSHAFQDVEITYVPVFLGGIMQSTGNRPPIQIKNKDKWIEAERLRWASQFNIPIARPRIDDFPINTLPVQRALTAIQLRYPDSLIHAIGTFFDAVWGPPRNTVQAHDVSRGGLGKILAQALGPSEAQEVVESLLNSDQVKERLKMNTSQAIHDGAFGLPWFMCENASGEKEGFWGFDHIAQVVDFLGLDRKKLGSGGRAML